MGIICNDFEYIAKSILKNNCFLNIAVNKFLHKSIYNKACPGNKFTNFKFNLPTNGEILRANFFVL